MVDPTRIIPLWQVLCFAAALACVTLNVRCARAAAGLLVNWCLLTAVASATGNQYGWIINGTVDYATAVITLVPAANLGQILLIASFALGMIFHALYGLSPKIHPDMVRYWWRFHYLAWFQAAVVLVWVGVVGGFNLVRWTRRRRLRQSVGPGYPGVGIEGA